MDNALVIVITFFAAVVADRNPFQPVEHYDLRDAPELFAKFIEFFDKKYKDDIEKASRYERFIENLLEINKHNRKWAPEHLLAITQFADLSHAEFVECCTGLKNMTDEEPNLEPEKPEESEEPEELEKPMSCKPGTQWIKRSVRDGKKVCQECQCYKDYGWGCFISDGPCQLSKYCMPGASWLKPQTVDGKKECHQCNCRDEQWQCEKLKDGSCELPSLKGDICLKGGLSGKVQLKPCMECDCHEDGHLVCQKITRCEANDKREEEEEEDKSEGGGVVEPEREGVVEPEGAGVVEPEAGGVVEPEGAGVVEPEGAGVVEPEAGGVVEPEEDSPPAEENNPDEDE